MPALLIEDKLTQLERSLRAFGEKIAYLEGKHASVPEHIDLQLEALSSKLAALETAKDLLATRLDKELVKRSLPAADTTAHSGLLKDISEERKRFESVLADARYAQEEKTNLLALANSIEVAAERAAAYFDKVHTLKEQLDFERAQLATFKESVTRQLNARLDAFTAEQMHYRDYADAHLRKVLEAKLAEESAQRAALEKRLTELQERLSKTEKGLLNLISRQHEIQEIARQALTSIEKKIADPLHL